MLWSVLCTFCVCNLIQTVNRCECSLWFILSRESTVCKVRQKIVFVLVKLYFFYDKNLIKKNLINENNNLPEMSILWWDSTGFVTFTLISKVMHQQKMKFKKRNVFCHLELFPVTFRYPQRYLFSLSCDTCFSTYLYETCALWHIKNHDGKRKDLDVAWTLAGQKVEHGSVLHPPEAQRSESLHNPSA